MKDFFDRIRQYLHESAERKLIIGGMTVSRLTIFGIAAGILLAAIFALIYIMYGKRDTALTYEKTDVDIGYTYRQKDNLLSYRAGEYLFTYDGEKNIFTFYPVNGIQGYDASPSMTIVYAGAAFKIQGNKETLALSDGTILDVRAGINHAALLFMSPSGDNRILLLDRRMNAVNTLNYNDSEVVAFGLLDGGSKEYLWVSTTDVRQFSEESIVRIYDCDTGAMIHYSSAFYNQSIYKAYLSGSCLFLVGTQSIVRYDRDGDGFSAERDRIRVYGSTVTDFAPAGESAYFIALPDTAEGAGNNLVRLITVSQTDDLWSTVMQKYLPAPVVGAFVHKGSLCVFTQDHFLQYSFAGKKLLDLEQDNVPTAVYECGDAAFLVFTGSACYRATLE